MSTPSSIIVYRNPAEAAFWEGGYLIPIFAGCGAGVAVFLICAFILDALQLSKRWATLLYQISGLVSIVVGFYVCNRMIL